MTNSQTIIEYTDDHGRQELSRCCICNRDFDWLEKIFSKRSGVARMKRYCIQCAKDKNLL